MTLPPRFAICPLCNGIHQHVPCPGRRQTEAEWLIDRGVRPERAHAIVAAREQHGGLPSLVLPPDPLTPPGPPYGRPTAYDCSTCGHVQTEPGRCPVCIARLATPDHVQEALF